MSVLTTLGVFNYGLVLLYGLFLSTFISGGWENTKQRTLVFAACPLFLMIQSVCWLALGADMARQLYPLITHLPLALILICILKKKVDVALVSICTAYLCCQLPRWVDLVVTALTRSELIGEICYTLVIGPLFYLLYRFFVRPAYAAMMASPQSLLLFGSLPVAYYIISLITPRSSIPTRSIAATGRSTSSCPRRSSLFTLCFSQPITPKAAAVRRRRCRAPCSRPD